jgi:hypothetical protein
MADQCVILSNDAARSSLVKLVAEAASVQAKVTNRLWLAVIAVTIVVFLPTTPGATTVQLPFNLGAVPPGAFYPVVFAILSILAVALAAAHAQQVRADRIAHHVVTELSSGAGKREPVSLHLRDLLDILRHPSLTRVAPLAQVITGHYHSQIKSDDSQGPGTNKRRAWTLAAFYLLLKLFTLVVLFVIPMAGVVVAYRRVTMALDGWLLYVLALTGLVAFLSLLLAAIADSRSVRRVAATLCRGAQ